MNTAPPAPNNGGARGDRAESSPAPPLLGAGGTILLIAACVLVRLIALDADPPPWLSWSSGVYTDEGFYTLDARHEALFGTWAPGNFHDRLLSPLLSMLQQSVFAWEGVGIVQARLISVVFGLLTVGVLGWGLRRAYGVRAALWGVLFLGLAPPFVFYNRLALQETPTVFWLVLAWALCVAGRGAPRGRKQTVLFALMGCAAAIALIFKPLAAIALPGLMVGWWRGGPLPALVGHPSPVGTGEGLVNSSHGSRDGETISVGQARKPAPPQAPPAKIVMSRSHWPLSRSYGGGVPDEGGEGAVRAALIAFVAVLGLYGLLWYAPHHVELARMGHYYRTHQFQPHSPASVWLNIRRGVIGWERGVLPYLLRLLPVPCLIALLGLRRRAGADLVFVFWLLGGLAFCLLSSYAPDRYYVLFVPALCGLAAIQAAKLPRWGQGLALGMFLVTSGFWYGRAWGERDWARQEAAQTLARTLPAGSMVIGDMAPALCLGTPFRAAPVQPGLSNTDHPVERLGATYVAVTRAPDWQRWWRAHYPDSVQSSHHVLALALHGRLHLIVDIYRVAERKR